MKNKRSILWFVFLVVLVACTVSSMLLPVPNKVLAQDQQDGRGVGTRRSESGTKVALVIGNADYSNDIGKLKNPVNDATDIAEALQRLGFNLVGGKAHLNLNKRQMLERIREFGSQIQKGGVGVFYYAGHGIQVDKHNYLIPITDLLQYQEDAEYEAVDVDAVLKEMESAENAVNILILDACRNNNLPKRPNKRATAEKGLGEPQRKPSGVYIAFAARDGQTASENPTGRNGLYTQELLKNIETPNLRLEDIFINTRREVKRLSNRMQEPIEFGSLDDIFYFKLNENIAIQPQPSPSFAIPNNQSNTIPMNQPTASTLPVGTIKKNSIGMELVWIPSGEFMMGSSESEIAEALFEAQKGNKKVPRDVFSPELPKHRVRISNGFWIGRYEVTQKQWQEIMDDNPSDYKDCGLNCPIEQISWYDTQVFLKRLNEKDSVFEYRLPTEAEWEYACRAGTTTAFAFGDKLNSSQANFDGRFPYNGTEKGKFVKKTTPVGSYQPNAWGLYDMHGNVWEWVEDWYGNYISGDVVDPTGPVASTYKSVRGGAWVNLASLVRSAARTGVKPDFRKNNAVFSPDKNINVGLRVVARLKG